MNWNRSVHNKNYILERSASENAHNPRYCYPDDAALCSTAIYGRSERTTTDVPTTSPRSTQYATTIHLARCWLWTEPAHAILHCIWELCGVCLCGLFFSKHFLLGVSLANTQCVVVGGGIMHLYPNSHAVCQFTTSGPEARFVGLCYKCLGCLFMLGLFTCCKHICSYIGLFDVAQMQCAQFQLSTQHFLT